MVFPRAQLPDGEKLPFDRAGVISRFETNGKAVLEGRSWSDKASFAKDLAREVAYFRNPRLPEALDATDSREICDITQRYFVPWHLGWPKRNEVVDDSAAAFGKAMQFKGSAGWAANPVELKLAGLTHALKPASFPRDGQYHLYQLGRTRLLGNDQNFTIFVNGKVTGGLDLGTRINHRESASEWDFSVSAKLVGPSFSKDSGDTDAIIIEPHPSCQGRPGVRTPGGGESVTPVRCVDNACPYRSRFRGKTLRFSGRLEVPQGPGQRGGSREVVRCRTRQRLERHPDRRKLENTGTGERPPWNRMV